MAAKISAQARRKLFVLEWIKDFDAARAVVDSGFKIKDRRTAQIKGYQLLAEPEVRAEIDKAMNERAQKVGLSAEWIVKELMKMASVETGEIYDCPPEKIPGLPDDQQPKAGRKVRYIHLLNKTKSLELLGKHLKLWTDKLDVSGDVNLKHLTDEELHAEIKSLSLKLGIKGPK